MKKYILVAPLALSVALLCSPATHAETRDTHHSPLLTQDYVTLSVPIDLQNIGKTNKVMHVQEFITLNQERIKRNGELYAKTKHVFSKPNIGEIQLYLDNRQKQQGDELQQIKRLMEKEKLNTKKNEAAFRELFALLKKEERTAKKLHEAIKERSVYLLKQEYQRKSLVLEKWKVRDEEGELGYMETLARASEGADQETVSKIATITKSGLFFNHELIPDINLAEGMMDVKEFCHLFGFHYAEKDSLRIIKDTSRTLVSQDGGSVEINQEWIGNIELFEEREGQTFIDLEKTLKLFGYSVIHINKNTPYIYKEPFPATPFSLLSVDELIQTMYATTLVKGAE